jgi:DNA-binding NtrC family response regulator
MGVTDPAFAETLKEPGNSSATVLIADDDPAIRLVLRHRLEADGCRVEEAIDSAAALAALRSGRFDVALLDIIMPGNGGLEVLSTAHAEAVRTLIIVITAASTMNNAVEAMKRGAHDYLTKPFANLDLVAAAVERAVEVASQAADLDRLKDEVNRQLVGGEVACGMARTVTMGARAETTRKRGSRKGASGRRSSSSAPIPCRSTRSGGCAEGALGATTRWARSIARS